MNKLRDLGIITLIYILAYTIGWTASLPFSDWMTKFFIFDLSATVVTFIFSVLLHNSSVYDAYWSLTPLVMVGWIFIYHLPISIWQALFYVAFAAWSLRLTINWIIVFTDFSYEDWRYRKFRRENGPFMWFIANFFGIHMVPTLVVFAGMLPIFEITRNPLGIMSIPGIVLIIIGVTFEFLADRQMHAHLASRDSHTVCRIGLWKYSRHPNYLSEITVWAGVFTTMLPYATQLWYYGIGVVAVAVLFNVVSIPLMEARQLKRRPEYADYQLDTSRLLIMPPKKPLGDSDTFPAHR